MLLQKAFLNQMGKIVLYYMYAGRGMSLSLFKPLQSTVRLDRVGGWLGWLIRWWEGSGAATRAQPYSIG